MSIDFLADAAELKICMQISIHSFLSISVTNLQRLIARMVEDGRIPGKTKVSRDAKLS